jgi:hypothetical protein
MATKRPPKTTIQSIVDAIGDLMRQPYSDESNVPTKSVSRRSKRVAAGPRTRKTVKKTKAKKGAAKKRTTSKKAKPAARKKKR